MSNGSAFDNLKVRYCLAAIIIAYFWKPGSRMLARAIPDLPWYWRDLIYSYYSDGVLILFLVGVALASHFIGRVNVVGRAPLWGDTKPIVLTVVFTFCASSAIITFTVIPLSYLLPTFVAWWLDWTFGPIIYVSADRALPIGANFLNFVSLVVVSPVVQEFIFRGYLLHRWSKKWGLLYGVILSSAVFGAVHPDTLPAMVTGIGFAILYLKTQSIWAPIIAHGIYNLIVWLWHLHDVIGNDFNYVAYDIDKLRADWWMGAIELIVVLLLVDRILSRNRTLGPFRLPTSDGSNA